MSFSPLAIIVLIISSFTFAQQGMEDFQPDVRLTQDSIPRDSTPAPSDTVPPDTSMQPPAPSDTTRQDTTDIPSSDTAQVPQHVKEIIDERNMEIGLMFGEPTGVSYKYFINDLNAVDAAAAVAFVPNAVFQLSADFLRHYYRFANVGDGRLPLVYGGGLVVQFREETRLGIRIPVGLTYIMQNLPIALFFDAAPRFDIVPDTEVSINASVGIRYRFSSGR